MDKFIENLNWRYAAKSFTDRNISEDELGKLLESVQLSASSYGLQPYEIAVISDPDLKKELRKAAFDQPQITECSHLFVFAGFNEMSENYLDEYINNISTTRDIPVKDLLGMRDTIKNTTLQFPKEKFQNWAAHQAYLALGFLLNAAATYRIDACPMEGFENDKFDDLLNLREKGLHSAVIAATGYRSDQDSTQKLKKVRKPQNQLFINYGK